MNCSRMWRRPCSRRRTNYSTADQPSPQCSTCSTSHLLTISRPFDISSWFVFVCLCPAHRSCQGGVNLCCRSCPRFPHIPWFMDSSGQSVQTAKVPRFTNSGHTGTMCPSPQPVFAPACRLHSHPSAKKQPAMSFVHCGPAPLGDLVPRNQLNETSSSGSSYLVGPRESHLDLHHLLWSLLSWIAVMTVTCYSRKSPTRPRVWGIADTIVSIVQLGSCID